MIIREQIAAADPKDDQAQFDLGAVCTDMAESLTNTSLPEEALDYARRSVKIHETLMAADPGDAVYMRGGRLAYEQLGNAHAALTANASLDAAARRDHWADARTAYEHANKLVSDLAAKGVVRSGEGEAPERLKSKIAKCDGELAQVGR